MDRPTSPPPGPEASPGPSRRLLLTAGIAGAGGAAVGAMAGRALAGDAAPPMADAVGHAVVAFHGPHQAGVDTPGQAAVAYCAFDLDDSTDREAVSRLLRLWSDDAARLTQGEPALADTEGELAVRPGRLTVTLGLGPRALDIAGLPRAERHGVAELPAFSVDRLEDKWSGGDLLVRVGSDDWLAVAHAVRMLTKDVHGFGVPRWRQDGFQRAAGTAAPGTTPRNLMGQVDGTSNPQPGTADFSTTVWISDGPAAGGTTMVLRRIAMRLDAWDALDRPDREQVIGRRLSDGAPLTGQGETDPPDFAATDATGLPVIADFAHIRRAHQETTGVRVFRQPYNYEQVGAGGATESGLLLATYQADVRRQFVPIQASLDELDLLNQWTAPVGSSVFLVVPGCQPGGYLGDTLF